jgi:putative membrane protein
MMGFDFGGFSPVLMLVFWVAIIALAIWLLSHLFPQTTDTSPIPFATQHNDPPESPLDILKRRYARGEISRAEYEQMRRDLTG